MDINGAAIKIEELLQYALKHGIIEDIDMIQCRNSLLNILKINEPYNGPIPDVDVKDPHEILDALLDFAYENGIIQDNTITNRDLFDTKIMGLLMPRESEVVRKFNDIKKNEGIEKATDYFYALSKDSYYIRMDRIAKNLYWRTNTDYGKLEITVNLSKPEKDPKDIAAAKSMKQTNYPKCLLCVENVGFSGNLNHPARQNHRVIPITVAGEQWYFQYSPYVYYNEHCILLYENHVPMKISEKTFIRLLDFIDQFPHYFMGSNADLPIVGGSILVHEHFQGGRHVFPMEEAAIEQFYRNKSFPDVKAGIVKWPLSVIRLSSKNKDKLIELSSLTLKKWRDYSDPSADILAYSEKDGKVVPHNTITPIARKNKNDEYELDLVLRNNRTTDKYPYGIFHPHVELHHIKKENIGLIEVMGLAVLPGRLKNELDEIEKILTGDMKFDKTNVDEGNMLFKHIPWIDELIDRYGTRLNKDEAENVLKDEVGNIFLKVLMDAGVYKRDDKGKSAFERFLSVVGFNKD